MPNLSTILIVDDEPQIRRALRNALSGEAGRILEVSRGSEAIDQAAAARPSLIVLDLGLPDMEGLRVCREIRAWSSVPILVLSARHAEHEKVALLDAGADDYVSKPFSTAELRARVRAQLRRVSAPVASQSPVVMLDDVEIDLGARTVRRQGANIHLTPTEWALLRAFLTHRGRTVTHRQLFNSVWPHSSGDPQQYLRVYVANMRRKIESDPVRPRYIITEPGIGYRFETPR